MNVTSLRRPANKPKRPAWRAPGPAKVPSWSARPPAQVVRRTTRTTVVQVDDAQLFAEEAPRAPPARVAAAPPPPPPPAWSPGTPRAASPPPPPFVHQGVVEWSPPQPEDADDDIVWARPRPLPRPAPAPVLQASDRAVREQQPPRSPLEKLESLAAGDSDDSDDESASMPRDSDDASSAASPPARPNVRDDAGPASPTTMEAVGLLVEHAARLEDEVRRRTGVLEDEVIRLRTEGAAQETAALRGELAELRAAILGAVRRDPEPHDEIEKLRNEVAELRASARLPPEDLGDALAAVTRAAVDKVAAVRNQVADRHWVPEDAAAPTGVEQASADRHRAQDDDAAERTGVEQAPVGDATGRGPLGAADDGRRPRLLVPHGDARDDVGAARASHRAGGRGGGAGGDGPRARRAGRPDRRARGEAGGSTTRRCPGARFYGAAGGRLGAADGADGRRLLVPYRDARDDVGAARARGCADACSATRRRAGARLPRRRPSLPRRPRLPRSPCLRRAASRRSSSCARRSRASARCWTARTPPPRRRGPTTPSWRASSATSSAR